MDAEVLAAEGIPVYAFPESAAAVLGKVATYGIWRAGPHGIIPAFEDIDAASARATCRSAIERRGAGWLSAEEAGTVLSAFGLPVSRGKSSSAEAADADRIDGASGIEVRVGMSDDPSFGPLITFGLGGFHAEAVGDASVRVTPLTDRAAAAMVREIRGFPLLQGYKGLPPADLEALHDLLLRVSRLIEEVPEIAELELSPVFARAPGEGCRIAGSRIRVALPRKGQVTRYTTALSSRASGPTEGTILQAAPDDRSR
jgi:acyl-CoA synthetase (NDP forming)